MELKLVQENVHLTILDFSEHFTLLERHDHQVHHLHHLHLHHPHHPHHHHLRYQSLGFMVRQTRVLKMEFIEAQNVVTVRTYHLPSVAIILFYTNSPCFVFTGGPNSVWPQLCDYGSQVKQTCNLTHSHIHTRTLYTTFVCPHFLLAEFLVWPTR